MFDAKEIREWTRRNQQTRRAYYAEPIVMCPDWNLTIDLTLVPCPNVKHHDDRLCSAHRREAAARAKAAK